MIKGYEGPTFEYSVVKDLFRVTCQSVGDTSPAFTLHCLMKFMIVASVIQYCAKVMQTIIDKYCPLFLQFIADISAKHRMDSRTLK